MLHWAVLVVHQLTLMPATYRIFYTAGGDVDSFYSSASARSAYQAHLKTFVTHVNPLTKLVWPCQLPLISFMCCLDGPCCLVLLPSAPCYPPYDVCRALHADQVLYCPYS